MLIIKSILIFYKKLIVPTLVLSLVFGFIGFGISGNFSLKLVGISYILISLLIHYIIYELMYPNEYYFYFNFGLNKYILWACTFILSLIIGLILVYNE